jgi:hypothetical protein
LSRSAVISWNTETKNNQPISQMARTAPQSATE